MNNMNCVNGANDMNNMNGVSDIQNIEAILSYQNIIRNQTIPPNILKSIETIHKLIKKENENDVKMKAQYANTQRNPNVHHSNHGQNYGSNSNSNSNKNYSSQSQQRPSSMRQSSSYNDQPRQSSWRNMGNDAKNDGFVQQKYNSNHSNNSNNSNNSYNRNRSSYQHSSNHPTVHYDTDKETDTDKMAQLPYKQPYKSGGGSGGSGSGSGPHKQRYVSKFNKKSGTVDDTIIHTILLGKLNKISASNYSEIKEFIIHIISDQESNMIKSFMKSVFEKAVSEDVFCPLYARLLSELTATYPLLLSEMSALYNQYMEIFEEVEDGKGENYDELCERNIQKKYRRGYSQFLAELIKYNVIDTATFMKIITKIISQIELNKTNIESIKLNEEFADCLMKIIKAIKSAKDSAEDYQNNTLIEICMALKSSIGQQLQPYSVRNELNKGLSTKARFTFLDMVETIQLKM
jgi:hypothetical protein